MASSRCSVNTSTQFYTVIFTTRKSSCGKVMFSQACVIPSVWGDGVSLHAMGQAEVCILACNGVGVNFWYDLLLWPSGVVFCHGLMDMPSGVAFWFDLLLRPSGGLLLWPSDVTYYTDPTPWTSPRHNGEQAGSMHLTGMLSCFIGLSICQCEHCLKSLRLGNLFHGTFIQDALAVMDERSICNFLLS